MIEPIALYPPHPATTRAQGVSIAYDIVNQRIAYTLGRSVFVRPVDPNNSSAPAFQFTKHTSPTTAVSFSPSGNYIASGDQSGQVKIWDSSIFRDKDPLAEQPHIKSEFPILGGAIKAITWDADNSRIIAVGEGKEKYGHCFTWDSGNSVGEIQGHSDIINAVDIKPQRPYRAATVSNDKSMVFFTGPPFKFDKTVRDHSNVIRDVKFSPDGKYLITVGSDRLISIYDGKTADPIDKIENAHEGGIFGISWYKDSSKFVTCSADNKVKVWDSETFKSIKTLALNDKVSVENQLLAVVVTDAGIISVSTNGNLNYYDEDKITVIQGHQSGIISSAKIGGFVVTGGSDGNLIKWTVKENTLEPTGEIIGEGHTNYVSDILSHGDLLVTIGWDDTLKVWEDFKLLSELKLSAQPKKLIPNGKHISVLFENSVETYSIGKDIKLVTETKFTYESNDIDIISDKLLATNLNANQLEEFDIDLNKIKTKFDAIRSQPSIIRVSPDSQYIALGDSTGKYIIYNSDYSVKTTRWSYQTSKILDAKWSPDSKLLLTGGLDSGIYIYSIDKLTKVLKYPLAHQGGITRVEWLEYKDKKGVILSTGFDGAIKLWKVDLSLFF